MISESMDSIRMMMSPPPSTKNHNNNINKNKNQNNNNNDNHHHHHHHHHHQQQQQHGGNIKTAKTATHSSSLIKKSTTVSSNDVTCKTQSNSSNNNSNSNSNKVITTTNQQPKNQLVKIDSKNKTVISSNLSHGNQQQSMPNPPTTAKRRKKYDETIIDGFAINSFKTWEDLQDELNDRITSSLGSRSNPMSDDSNNKDQLVNAASIEDGSNHKAQLPTESSFKPKHLYQQDNDQHRSLASSNKQPKSFTIIGDGIIPLNEDKGDDINNNNSNLVDQHYKQSHCNRQTSQSPETTIREALEAKELAERQLAILKERLRDTTDEQRDRHRKDMAAFLSSEERRHSQAFFLSQSFYDGTHNEYVNKLLPTDRAALGIPENHATSYSPCHINSHLSKEFLGPNSNQVNVAAAPQHYESKSIHPAQMPKFHPPDRSTPTPTPPTSPLLPPPGRQTSLHHQQQQHRHHNQGPPPPVVSPTQLPSIPFHHMHPPYSNLPDPFNPPAQVLHPSSAPGIRQFYQSNLMQSHMSPLHLAYHQMQLSQQQHHQHHHQQQQQHHHQQQQIQSPSIVPSMNMSSLPSAFNYPFIITDTTISRQTSIIPSLPMSSIDHQTSSANRFGHQQTSLLNHSANPYNPVQATQASSSSMYYSPSPTERSFMEFARNYTNSNNSRLLNYSLPSQPLPPPTNPHPSCLDGWPRLTFDHQRAMSRLGGGTGVFTGSSPLDRLSFPPYSIGATRPPTFPPSLFVSMP